MSKKPRIEVADLDDNAATELTEDDVQKITGGAWRANTVEVVKMPGPPAPFVTIPYPNVTTIRTR